MTSDEEQTLRKFQFERTLNEDTRTKSLSLLGKIDSEHAIIIAEKTAFDSSAHFLTTVKDLKLLGHNDIYHWFLGSQTSAHPDVKFTLIYPATETHIRKYSQQRLRMVTETPEVYETKIKPYVESKRVEGRLNWVYNILEYKAEKERILYDDQDEQEGFILLPDLKWDQMTMSALYTMAIVRRRDITSMRDLKKKDVPWLRKLSTRMIQALATKYPEIEGDQIKLYVHYHPSYYHFHIHAVATTHDGGFGQAAGKAFLLENVISQLEGMQGGEDDGFEKVNLSYMLGEESELWQTVFVELKRAT